MKGIDFNPHGLLENKKWKGTSMTIPEKRRSQRSDLTTSCHSEFLYAGKKHAATMIDLSEHGARFTMEKSSDHTEFAIGDELSLLVVTPYGQSQCSGRIVWTGHHEEYYSWGVEFVHLSEDPGDPLRCLIESPF
jgi:hypothetical protein